MYAVVVNVTIEDPEGAEDALKERIVPAVAGSPGFVTGYWTRKGNSGLSMVVFETEEAATAMSEQIRTPEGVSVSSVEVREVVAHA